jgi:predicted RNase H-like HicB family nuclease
MKYKVILQTTEDGFTAYCPTLPSCWASGETEQHALDAMRHAIYEHLIAIENSMENLQLKGKKVYELDIFI